MIRRFGLRDVLAIRQLAPQGVGFDLRRQFLHPQSPVVASLGGYLAHYPWGPLTYVHDGTLDKEAVKGFAQVRPRPSGLEWDLVYLAPALDYHPKAGVVWNRLLSFLTVRGAQLGVERIRVRCVEDAETEDIFRQVGYTVVCREEVFVLARTPVPAVVPRGLRPLAPQDQAAIAALYREVVPQLVQQAEGSDDFRQVTRLLARFGALPVVEYIWSERGKAIAHLTLHSGAEGYWLDVLVRPEYRADLLPHIKYILSLTECSESLPVYCPVPDYGVGLGWVLRTVGFESFARQALLVAYTVARVRVQRHVLVRGLEPTIEVGTPVGNVCPTDTRRPETVERGVR